MKTNDMKELWEQAIPQNRDIDVAKIIKLKHCQPLSKSISQYRIRAIIFLCSFLIVTLLVLYAFGYLNLNCSLSFFGPLIIAGLFLLVRFVVEYNRYLSLRKDYDLKPILEAEKLIESKIKRLGYMDFISYLILFYSIAIVLYLAMSTDAYIQEELGGIMWLAIVILFILPWIIRFCVNKR